MRFAALMILLMACSLPIVRSHDKRQSSACMEPTYRVSGHVLTNSGVSIRNARVTAVRSEDGMAWSTASNTFGEYSLRIPNCGTFTLSAAVRGLRFPSYLMTLPSDQFTDGREIDLLAQ